ncbi:MAG: 2-succinyl-5-enolpyruvyl-6-hydroxy-3-cyclohexene-1-carboxylic-acid synthase [Bacteroidetes bacterium]|nr:2-succinyl-5-enolpyruvyl-6-hydroxy-3-cyclohexene-1-carboxylic-acid synthase [Bacteroidota bacterium]
MQNQSTLKLYEVLAGAAKICVAHGVQHVVLSPGSRSAPLALSFMRNPDINHYIIPDERSASYTALGMAQSLGKAVALVCTSGTAALNYAPAIAEAFFSKIPLLVITADRPAEWIGQADNQAIFQENIYGKHVKSAFNFPSDFSHPDAQWHAWRVFNEALNIANTQPCAPVHINVPMREPLYLDAPIDASQINPKIIKREDLRKAIDFKNLSEELKNHKKILFVAGLNSPNKNLKEILENFIAENKQILIPDITSNLHGVANAINFYDEICANPAEDLFPDLVISFGGAVVSKKLKEFIKNPNVKEHWHISDSETAADTFQKLTKIINADAADFFAGMEVSPNPSYLEKWNTLNNNFSQQASTKDWDERSAINFIQTQISGNSVLHLGNSLPIRHVMKNPILDGDVEVFSNRGTSGIDGCLSTAVGHSMLDARTQTLIVGDLSFMYDRNGLWNNYLKGNLKIIILNNHGGRIFEKLPGAAKQPELQEYFVTHQPLNFKATAAQHNCEYFLANDFSSLENGLKKMYGEESKSPQVLEVELTNPTHSSS